MLEEIYYFINHYTSFFYGVIYKGDYFFIDYWSFVHLTIGIWIVFFTYHKRYRHPFLLLGLALFAWELMEISFIYLAVHVFKPETIPDQFTDIFIGFAGGFLGWFLWRTRRKPTDEAVAT